MHAVSHRRWDSLSATQGLTNEISCAMSVPGGEGWGAFSQHSLWSAILEHVCADLRTMEAPSCSSEAATAMWAREREAKVPAALPVLFWDLLQWK